MKCGWRLRPWSYSIVGVLLLISSSGLILSCGAEQQSEENEILKEVMELKEREGKDNAIIYYVEASKEFPGLLHSDMYEILWSVLEEGWSKKAEESIPFLARFQRSFELVRKGTRVGYAKWPDLEQADRSSVRQKALTDMLIFEAKYLETRDKHDQALDNYLTALMMARDMTCSVSYFIDHVIAIASASKPLRELEHLILSGALDAQDLALAQKRLRDIEHSWESIMDSFRNEISDRFFLRAQEDPEGAAEELRKGLEEYRKMKDEWFPVETFEQIEQGHITIEEIIAEAPRMATDLVTLREFELEYFQQPVWQRDKNRHLEEREQLLAKVHPYIAKSFSPHEHFVEADTRSQVLLAKLRETQVAAAVSLYRKENQKSPEQLDDLIPAYLDTVPVDPFSGKPLGFGQSPLSGIFSAYSVGPDLNDDAGEIEYDVTNGTLSQGDVFLR